MSESLCEDELADLISHGRISTSRSAAKRRQAKLRVSTNNARTEASVPHVRDSPREAELPKSSEKEPDPEWLIAEKEKAERNVAAHRQDRRQRDELQEDSKF